MSEGRLSRIRDTANLYMLRGVERFDDLPRFGQRIVVLTFLGALVAVILFLGIGTRKMH